MVSWAASLSGGTGRISWYMKMGTCTCRAGIWLGTMTGASIEAGPSPTTSAVPVVSSWVSEIVVMSNSGATPGGLRLSASAK
jgi:hypothetical protein